MKESTTAERTQGPKASDFEIPRVTPDVRMRRLRAKAPLRAMVRETHLRIDQLIYPMFLVEGQGVKNPIRSMPGIHQQSLDEMLREAEQVANLGLKSVLLFGIPQEKDSQATGAWHEDGIVQRATRELKKRFPELLVVADTCLCEYMDHGHCGIVHDGTVLNDPSLEILARTSVSQAAAGARISLPLCHDGRPYRGNPCRS